MSRTNSTKMERTAAALVLGLVVSFITTPAHAADLSGEWTGHWKSCKTGHKGPLRATFCKVDSCHYKVTFRGRFFKVIPFRYAVTLRVVRDGDQVALQGSQRLGRLLGDYHYRATASRCIFHSNYTSKDDCGYFHLERR